MYLVPGMASHGLIKQNTGVIVQWACMANGSRRRNGHWSTGSSIARGKGPAGKKGGSKGRQCKGKELHRGHDITHRARCAHGSVVYVHRIRRERRGEV